MYLSENYYSICVLSSLNFLLSSCFSSSVVRKPMEQLRKAVQYVRLCCAHRLRQRNPPVKLWVFPSFKKRTFHFVFPCARKNKRTDVLPSPFETECRQPIRPKQIAHIKQCCRIPFNVLDVPKTYFETACVFNRLNGNAFLTDKFDQISIHLQNEYGNTMTLSAWRHWLHACAKYPIWNIYSYITYVLYTYVPDM